MEHKTRAARGGEMDSITGSELLQYLLNSGWEWRNGEPGYVVLAKGDFVWIFEAGNVSVRRLIDMLIARGEK